MDSHDLKCRLLLLHILTHLGATLVRECVAYLKKNLLHCHWLFEFRAE